MAPATRATRKSSRKPSPAKKAARAAPKSRASSTKPEAQAPPVQAAAPGGEWEEPPLRAPAPSYRDHVGGGKMPVLNQMQPLGTPPSARVKKQAKPEPFRRRTKGPGEDDGDARAGPAEPSSAPGRSTPTPPPAPLSPAASRYARMKAVVDRAVEQARTDGQSPVAAALMKLYEEGLGRPELAELLDAVLSLRETTEQAAQFQEYIKAVRQEAGPTSAASSSSALSSVRSSPEAQQPAGSAGAADTERPPPPASAAPAATAVPAVPAPSRKRPALGDGPGETEPDDQQVIAKRRKLAKTFGSVEAEESGLRTTVFTSAAPAEPATGIRKNPRKRSAPEEGDEPTSSALPPPASRATSHAPASGAVTRAASRALSTPAPEPPAGRSTERPAKRAKTARTKMS